MMKAFFGIAIAAIIAVAAYIYFMDPWGGNGPLADGRFSLSDEQVSAQTTGKFDPHTQNRLYQLTAPLTFFDGDQEWTAPAGTLVDFASIPDWAIPVTGRPDKPEIYRASIVHDAFCQESSECDKYRSRSWQATHKMFYDACVVSGAKPSDAALWTAAVRIGGSKWDEHGNTIPNSLSIFSYSALQLFREWTSSQQPKSYQKVDEQLVEWETIAQHEVDAQEALERDDLDAAERSLEQAELLLDSDLNKDSTAPLILSFKGHQLKNNAILSTKKQEFGKAADSLKKAMENFQKVLESEPKDASALNGMGSAYLIRANIHRENQETDAGLADVTTAKKYIDDTRQVIQSIQALKAVRDSGFVKEVDGKTVLDLEEALKKQKSDKR